MKHYHGTPIGGTRESAEVFARGRHLLIPWKRPENLELAMQFTSGFMVDNSAFTFWSSGETPKWREYLKWLRTFARHPRFDFAVIPDTIDGTAADNDDLIKRWEKSSAFPVRINAAPVWHMHEPIGRLARLCDRWDIVGIGSSGEYATPGTESWDARMFDAFDAICDEDGYPKAKIHGFRMLRGDIVSRFPFSSCDSTNAVQNGSREGKKNGVDGGWGTLNVARRMELVQSPSRWDRAEAKRQVRFELIG